MSEETLRGLHAKMPVNSINDVINRLFEIGEYLDALTEDGGGALGECKRNLHLAISFLHGLDKGMPDDY